MIFALEAALEFFDDCENVTELSSGHSSDDSSSSIHNVSTAVKPSQNGKKCRRRQLSADAQEIARVKAKLSVPGRNRSRDLQKLELLQLRVESVALQEKLNKLRHSSLTRHHATISLDAWRSLAEKQKRRCRDAEITNEELRMGYAKQIETMKSLKRIFRKQVEAKRSACIVRNFFANTYYDAERDAILVIEQLSSTLNNTFADTDRVFRSNGMDMVTSPFSKTNTQPLSATSTYIEVLKCAVLPFDYRAVADAFYGKVTAGCGLIKVVNINTSKAQVQNVIARAFTVEVKEKVKIQYRDATLRYS
ncbi:hypothetical protein P3T76_010480 [Phytophthora citrophthora]|uniref:M96 mating-specific protein family n=1 Tax=Phytophthora citrophthora TaxID=4793 RepID=A0AAD9GC32_9STRA|nr:hypothetical protein P3T76_010480 [Phytophthora citrophthora]